MISRTVSINPPAATFIIPVASFGRTPVAGIAPTPIAPVIGSPAGCGRRTVAITVRVALKLPLALKIILHLLLTFLPLTHHSYPFFVAPALVDGARIIVAVHLPIRPALLLSQELALSANRRIGPLVGIILNLLPRLRLAIGQRRPLLEVAKPGKILLPQRRAFVRH